MISMSSNAVNTPLLIKVLIAFVDGLNDPMNIEMKPTVKRKSYDKREFWKFR